MSTPETTVSFDPNESNLGLSRTNGASQSDHHYDTSEIDLPVIPQSFYDTLPKRLQKSTSYLEAWHRRDVYVTSLLGVLSSCLPQCRFNFGGFWHGPDLYMFIGAEPGTGKSATRHATHLADKVDEMIRDESEAERGEWALLKENYESQKKRRCKSLNSPKSLNNPNSPTGSFLETPGPPPPERMLKAAANTTSAALCQRLAANPNGILITSTEADVLTSSDAKEHGNFKHTLRQATHHEEIQVDRKTEETLYVRHPHLAIVLTGTPRQLGRLMEGGLEDGLFSRFCIYRLSTQPTYESQRPKPQDAEFESFQNEFATKIKEVYAALRSREEPIYFKADDKLWDILDSHVGDLHDRLARSGNRHLLAIIRRIGLVTYRIAVVLAAWRVFDGNPEASKAKSIEIREEEMRAAVSLALVYAEHALHEAKKIEKSAHALPDTSYLGAAERLTARQQQLLFSLPNQFSASSYEKAAQEAGAPRSTAFRWLNRFIEAGHIRKESHGSYEKRGGETFGISGIIETSETLATPIDDPPDACEYIGGETVQTPDGVGVIAEATPAGRTQIPVRFENGTGTQLYRPDQVARVIDSLTSGVA